MVLLRGEELKIQRTNQMKGHQERPTKMATLLTGEDAAGLFPTGRLMWWLNKPTKLKRQKQIYAFFTGSRQ